jgi:hypothetical protein
VTAIFDHWKAVCKHTNAVLDPKRRGLIEKALKSHGLTVAMDAVTGCSRSAWHMGANDRGARFDDLTLILRDASRIEQFAAMATGTVGPQARVGQGAARTMVNYQGYQVTPAAPMPLGDQWARGAKAIGQEFDDLMDAERAKYQPRKAAGQ